VYMLKMNPYHFRSVWDMIYHFLYVICNGMDEVIFPTRNVIIVDMGLFL